MREATSSLLNKITDVTNPAKRGAGLSLEQYNSTRCIGIAQKNCCQCNMPDCKKTSSHPQKIRVGDGDNFRLRDSQSLHFSFFTFWCDATLPDYTTQAGKFNEKQKLVPKKLFLNFMKVK